MAKHRLGDGICDGGQFSTKKCQYDDFDCNDMRSNYPLCELEALANQVINTANPPRLGNNVCDSKIYNTEECGFENGDCATCNNLVHDFALTGDGVCHGGYHNSEECNYDAGDCEEFNLNYPRCEAVAARTEKMVAIPIIGDKICNSGLYNNPDCGYEDGEVQYEKNRFKNTAQHSTYLLLSLSINHTSQVIAFCAMNSLRILLSLVMACAMVKTI